MDVKIFLSLGPFLELVSVTAENVWPCFNVKKNQAQLVFFAFLSSSEEFISTFNRNALFGLRLCRPSS